MHYCCGHEYTEASVGHCRRWKEMKSILVEDRFLLHAGSVIFYII